MQSGLYVALSSQMALERRITTIADNMANINTAGYRATEVKFDEVLSKTRNDMNAKVAFVSQGNDYLSTRSGSLDRTGNPLDVAVKGDAWLSVDTPNGQVMTRDGRLTIREDGILVSTNGYPVLDAGGGQIELNRAGGEIKIGADGAIVQDDRQIALLGLYTADISQGYLRHDNSGITTVAAPQPVVNRNDAGIMQGYTEQSNVNGISEMMQLIQVNRAFDSISSVMRETESTFGEAIKTLGGSR